MDALPPINPSSPSANEPDAAEEDKKDDLKREQRSAAFKKSMQQSMLQQAPLTADAPPAPKAPPGSKAPPGKTPATADAATDGQLTEAPQPASSGETSVPGQALGQGKAAGSQSPGAKLPGAAAQRGAVSLRYQPNLANLTPAQLKLLSTPPKSGKGAAGPTGDKLAGITEGAGLPTAGAEAAQTGAAPDLPATSAVTGQARAQMDAGAKPKESAIESKRQKEDKEEPSASAGTPTATFLPQQQAPTAPAASRIPLPPEMVQQMVEFAAVHTNSAGNMEFHLGLSQNVLGGLRIKLSAYGGRRVGISVRGGQGAAPLTEADLSDLVESLRSKGIDVVDVAIA